MDGQDAHAGGEEWEGLQGGGLVVVVGHHVLHGGRGGQRGPLAVEAHHVHAGGSVVRRVRDVEGVEAAGAARRTNVSS